MRRGLFVVARSLSYLSKGHILLAIGDFDSDPLTLRCVRNDTDESALNASDSIALIAGVLELDVPLVALWHWLLRRSLRH